ncbi:MAG: T9SS type A sorting domain-containing protein [Syntrophothermus sp.]
MKRIFLFLSLFAFSTVIFGQNYPHISVIELQTVSDSALGGGNDASQYLGDTVVVTGVVMSKTVNDAHKPIMWAGARWTGYLRDTSFSTINFSGVNIIQMDTLTTTSGMDLLDTAMVVEITGKVSEFGKQTQLEVVSSIPIGFVGGTPSRGEPVEVTIADFVNGTAPNLVGGEKYEGAYVIIKNVNTTDRNTGAVANPFSIVDGSGNKLIVHGQSGYFTKRDYKLRVWDPPVNGTTLPYIRGVIGQNSDGSFVIRPIYMDDVLTGAAPPVVSSIRRSLGVVTPSTPVDITAKILDIDAGGFVTSAKLLYRVNGGTLTTLNMTAGADSIWSAQIPGVADSALVDYFVWAQDNDGKVTVEPVDTARSRYFYLVLNRPLTIQDVQYSPFGGGYSAYNNYRVTITGTVTADTSDLQGDGNQVSRRVHIQNGTGPWSGIQVGGLEADNLVRGQNVTISGLIMESNSFTKIDSITQVVTNSTGNALPPFEVLSTSVISNLAGGTVQAEQWESVLVEYPNVLVTDENSDGNPGPNITGNSNFGEISVADTASDVPTRVELQEGNHPYHNLWDAALDSLPGNIHIRQGDYFTALRGVMYYSFSNYKLVPRKADDFVGYISDVTENNSNTVVESYQLSQNYPNPFNPSTTITYQIPTNGFVTIKIYNVLGKEVKTLVSQDQNAGNYSVRFDARDLSSGVYFYQINVNNFTTSKKMLLLK